MSHHDDDLDTNPSANDHIQEVIGERLIKSARRALVKWGLGLGALSFMGTSAAFLSGCGTGDGSLNSAASASNFGKNRDDNSGKNEIASGTRPDELGFAAVAKSMADLVTVPAGYTASVLYRLGDPIDPFVGDYRNDGSDDAASFARRAGDHHDGMHYFGLGNNGRFKPNSDDRALLCLNHEAITPLFIHPNGQTVVAGARTVAEEVLREFYLHGVSVVEIERKGKHGWNYRRDSTLNQRIHTLTDMILSGPASGSPLMATKYSPQGARTRGTVNNCANGHTPWGTYLTCEENWAGYFRRVAANDNPKRSGRELAALARYGVAGNGRELWATVTPDTADDLYGRWNAEVRAESAQADYRNAPNTYGWVVEIDPFDPQSTPRKRTGMGRFAHEGAWPANVKPGKPLVYYMGCDSRNEYIYKYVSNALWNPSDEQRGATAGDKYLDDGRLYVARFNADGTGEWLELKFGVAPLDASNVAYAFESQSDVLVHARLAADALGATKMDRPEWGAVDPVTGAVYMTLTNNNATLRPLAATDAANPRHYNDPRTNSTAQRGNPNGHIIRWLESGADPSATTFRWDIYLFGARWSADTANINVSHLSADNDFSSPDGIWFSHATNICWIQTDDGAYTDVTNCMLLAALPGGVGDGEMKTIVNTDAAGNSKSVVSPVGAAPDIKLKRFLVGPVQCEITGMAESPDGKALFVNIQHPGEDTTAANIATPSSTWPGEGGARPRSATIVITRDDGGVIGV